MSGNSATYPMPAQIGTLPPEGSKQVTVSVAWANVFTAAAGFSTRINLLSQYQTGQFTSIQSAWIDNQTCPYECFLTVDDTQFRIRVPPFSAGMYPLVCGQAPSFTVLLNAFKDPATSTYLPTGSTKFTFLNTPEKPFETRELNFGSNFINATTQLNASVTAQNVLDAPGGNLHYAISGILITLCNQTDLTAYSLSPVYLRLGESGINPWWQDIAYPPPSQAGVFYSQFVNLPTPIITRSSTNAVQFSINATVTGGNCLAVVMVTAGLVSIQ